MKKEGRNLSRRLFSFPSLSRLGHMLPAIINSLLRLEFVEQQQIGHCIRLDDSKLKRYTSCWTDDAEEGEEEEEEEAK